MPPHDGTLELKLVLSKECNAFAGVRLINLSAHLKEDREIEMIYVRKYCLLDGKNKYLCVVYLLSIVGNDEKVV